MITRIHNRTVSKYERIGFCQIWMQDLLSFWLKRMSFLHRLSSQIHSNLFMSINMNIHTTCSLLLSCLFINSIPFYHSKIIHAMVDLDWTNAVCNFNKSHFLCLSFEHKSLILNIRHDVMIKLYDKYSLMNSSDIRVNVIHLPLPRKRWINNYGDSTIISVFEWILYSLYSFA